MKYSAQEYAKSFIDVPFPGEDGWEEHDSACKAAELEKAENAKEAAAAAAARAAEAERTRKWRAENPPHVLTQAEVDRMFPLSRPEPSPIDGRPAALGEKPKGESRVQPITFKPSPFVWRDPATIPKRGFVYGKHLIRGFPSATIAPSGVGKSSLVLVECVAMATGRPLLGIEPPKPLTVWYVNLEDPREELERRIAAICLRHGVKDSEIKGRLFFDGRETEIVLAEQTKSGATIAVPVSAALEAALNSGGFDVFMLDPFISAHRVSENDNTLVDMVVKEIGRIAGRTNCAAELVHHTRKTGGAEVSAEDSRGASALVAAARSVRVINPMSTEEAPQAEVSDEDRYSYFRTQIDKRNLAPPSKATWYKIEPVPLGNDDNDGPGDSIGVVTCWTWPDAFEGVTVDHLRKAQAAVAAGRFRENSQAKTWVGIPIAQALGLDPQNKIYRAKIKAVLKAWIANGMFVVVEGLDDKREKRSFVEVGEPAND